MGASRVLSVGISSTEVCGVRDAASVLVDELRMTGVDAETLWCELADAPDRVRRGRLCRIWLAALRAEVASGKVDAIVFHYSPWAFGTRGVPICVPRVARAFASSSVPVVGYLHEFAYPFGRRGWRGGVQAISQRVALIPVVGACDAVVATTEERADWLRSRPWLPKRAVHFVPVFSNVPRLEGAEETRATGLRVGIFGFASPGIDISAVGQAFRLVAKAGLRVELVLIGSPGSNPPLAGAWRSACSPHVRSVRFTGVKPILELAAEIAAVDVFLFPDGGGASSRRGTLAAALAAGKPVVAVVGAEQWALLVDDEAVVVVPAQPQAVAAALAWLCTDSAARVEQGARAERFYRLRMAPAVAAEGILSILRHLGVTAQAASASAPHEKVQPPVLRVRGRPQRDRALVGTVTPERKRLLFVVESSTDVRLVDGLADSFELSVVARTIENGVEISHPPATALAVRRTPSGRLRFAWEVFLEIVTRRCDLDRVLVQGYGVGALAANLGGRLARIPTTMLVCSPLEDYYRCRRGDVDSKAFRPAELAVLQLIARLNARLGEAYVVLSRHLASVVREHGTRRCIELCPVYGVDTNLFVPSAKTKRELRNYLDLPAHGALIFFSSRIAPEKDVDTLLAAVQMLVAEGRDLLLLNASGGHAELAERAVRFGLAERLIARRSLDPRGELAAYYQAADLCVQASRAEGLGFAPLEALACETPVVAADVGGLRETIVDGETGWTYRPGDAESLARAIGAALDAPEDGRDRAAAGRRRVLAEYECRVVFARLQSLLDGSLLAEDEGRSFAEGEKCRLIA